MNYSKLYSQLENNASLFRVLLEGVSKEEYTWKQAQEKWCMLEIVGHLYDEEKRDFKVRLQYALDSSQTLPPAIDPEAWVMEHKYMDKLYEAQLENFLTEREHSLNTLWLLKNPSWDNYFVHPTLGFMTAHMILSNWVAHDYLHMRQIIKLKYDYLSEITQESLSYAGEW